MQVNVFLKPGIDVDLIIKPHLTDIIASLYDPDKPLFAILPIQVNFARMLLLWPFHTIQNVAFFHLILYSTWDYPLSPHNEPGKMSLSPSLARWICYPPGILNQLTSQALYICLSPLRPFFGLYSRRLGNQNAALKQHSLSKLSWTPKFDWSYFCFSWELSQSKHYLAKQHSIFSVPKIHYLRCIVQFLFFHTQRVEYLCSC